MINMFELATIDLTVTDAVGSFSIVKNNHFGRRIPFSAEKMLLL